MDISNYTWVNSFEITNANVTNSDQLSTPQLSPTIIVTNNSNNILMKKHTLPGNVVEHNSIILLIFN
ncbi:8056_t:CDS:2 [Funneliformis mosseae]|uniref:8056_t:CDS:1 n=1 Tax=Funneliformis mosseae TaxID=27381 RepID=A0A9N9BK17_FUNMO|nr:8056_t:CDS:2 [Funneliformis mosseae]